jgi:hypothetical protein
MLGNPQQQGLYHAGDGTNHSEKVSECAVNMRGSAALQLAYLHAYCSPPPCKPRPPLYPHPPTPPSTHP